eukprot:CAMPEP_0113509246 /NCGR_PEP_ID=MMETSP0014_2-20120614/37461_1 /TAXON_ID=2857 /ORGANISM="Nitzschia sp." /LENGTH=643 /DNA_ID=CAMNT_0000405039 /DNA_START=150 /DNA_END=2081 /DNA_ORIENTATION=+ /assembly_acc=CAM_ASM_000159
MSDVVDDIIMMPAGEGQHSSEAVAMESSSSSSSSTSMPVPVPQQQQQQLTAAAAQSIAFASVAAAPQNRSQQAPNVVSPGVQQQQHHQTSGPQIVVHHPLQSQQQQQHPLPAPPTMMLDNIKDVVHVLKRRELTYCNTYSTTANNNNTSFDKWRPVMVSWMWSVIDTFSLMPQLVPTGLYFLDMCSSTSSKILTENGADPATAYPLMAMTALNLAVKVHETKMFPLDQLVLLFGKQGNNNSNSTASSSPQQQPPSKLLYTPKEVVEMEEKILRQCHWQLHPPTPHEFLLQFGLVLPVQYRSQVVIHAQQRVKHASLWDHARGGSSSHTSTPPPHMEPFLPSTMAYASLLLAMEDSRLNLPLEIKQTTCRALLQVSGLSAHTPHLEEAYNWMILATSLQDQLIQQRRCQQQQQQQQLQATSSKTTAAVPATVQKPTVAPPVAQTGPPAAGQSPPPPSGYWRDADSPSSSSSSSSEMTTEQEEEDSFDVSADHDILSCFGVGAKKSTGNYEDDDDRTATTVRSSMSSSFSTSSSSSSAVTVIFYSHTKSGDNGFEVTVSGFEDDDDYMIEKSMPAHVIVSPVGPPLHHIEVMDDGEEVPELQLVLSKSLDEDGVEIAMAQKYNLSEGEEQPELSNMIASPRMVNI